MATPSACRRGEKALLGGFGGAVLGAGIGAIIGSLLKKTFIIGGRKEEFKRMRTKLLNRAYRDVLIQ